MHIVCVCVCYVSSSSILAILIIRESGGDMSISIYLLVCLSPSTGCVRECMCLQVRECVDCSVFSQAAYESTFMYWGQMKMSKGEGDGEGERRV